VYGGLSETGSGDGASLCMRLPRGDAGGRAPMLGILDDM